MDLMTRRRALLARVQSGGWQLPDIYQAVEYIEQTGTQWIDTGIVPTSDLVAQITFMNIEGTGDVIFGFHGDGDTRSYRFFGNEKTYFDTPTNVWNTYRIYSGVLIEGVKYWLELGNHYIKRLDTGTIWTSTAPAPFAEVSKTITLGYYNDAKISKNRWYEILMSIDQVDIFHGVPCYRKNDLVAGMYDLVRMRFLTNRGTGEFIVGSDIN